MPTEYPKADHTVDIVIFRRGMCKRGQTEQLGIQVALIKRTRRCFIGKWAFVGGFLDIASGETLEEAAAREAKEEVAAKDLVLRQFRSYSDPRRDPDKRVITTVFLTAVPQGTKLIAGDDAGDAQWFDWYQMPELAFDHAEIFRDIVTFANPCVMCDTADREAREQREGVI